MLLTLMTMEREHFKWYMCRSRECAAVNDNLFMRVRGTSFYDSQSLVEDIGIKFYKYFHFEPPQLWASLTFSLVESLDLWRFVGNRVNFSRESSTIYIATSSIVQKYNWLTHSNHLRRLFSAFHSPKTFFSWNSIVEAHFVCFIFWRSGLRFLEFLCIANM